MSNLSNSYGFSESEDVISHRLNPMEIWNHVIRSMSVEERRTHLKIMKETLLLPYIKGPIKESWNEFMDVWKALKAEAFPPISDTATGSGKMPEECAKPVADGTEEELNPGKFSSLKNAFVDSLHPGEEIAVMDLECSLHSPLDTDGSPPHLAMRPNGPSGSLMYEMEPVSLRRQNVEQKRWNRRSQMMQKCLEIVQKMFRHSHGWFFHDNTNSLDVEWTSDQHENVVDLSSVRESLELGLYENPMDFYNDVDFLLNFILELYTQSPRRQYPNVDLQNSLDIALIVREMRSYFEDEFSDVKEMMDSDKELREREEATVYKVVGEREVDWEDLKRRLKELESQLKKRKDGNEGRKGNGGPKPKWLMRDEEKLILSRALGKLPEVVIEALVVILWSHDSELNGEEESLEVDIDDLDNEVLWALDTFVSGGERKEGTEQRKKVRRGKVVFFNLFSLTILFLLAS